MLIKHDGAIRENDREEKFLDDDPEAAHPIHP